MTVPIGTILAYAGDVDGNNKASLEGQGWLVCDGTEYLQSDYPDLENTIGTYYGAASRAGYFKVPDLRGLFLRGVDDGTGRDPDANSRKASAYGGNTGQKVGSYQDDAFEKHHHRIPVIGVENDGPKAVGTDPEKATQSSYDSWDAGSSETRPKNIYVNYIIKASNKSDR